MKVINRTLPMLAAMAAAAPISLATQHIQVDESKYGVEIFECDANLDELSHENRQKKMYQGTVIRVCFRPNPAALEDGIRIRKINQFIWEMSHEDGLAEQVAVENGKGDGAVSHLECLERGNLCFLDTMLGGDFYLNSGSVEGTGSAFLTIGDKPVSLNMWVFNVDFSVDLTDLHGDELTQEEQEELTRLYMEQQAALSESSEAEEPDDIPVEEQPTCPSPTCHEEGDPAQAA